MRKQCELKSALLREYLATPKNARWQSKNTRKYYWRERDKDTTIRKTATRFYVGKSNRRSLIGTKQRTLSEPAAKGLAVGPPPSWFCGQWSFW